MKGSIPEEIVTMKTFRNKPTNKLSFQVPFVFKACNSEWHGGTYNNHLQQTVCCYTVIDSFSTVTCPRCNRGHNTYIVTFSSVTNKLTASNQQAAVRLLTVEWVITL